MDYIINKLPNTHLGKVSLGLGVFALSTLLTLFYFIDLLNVQIPLDYRFNNFVLVTIIFASMLAYYSIYKNNIGFPVLLFVLGFVTFSVLNRLLWKISFQSYGDIDFLQIKIGAHLTFSRAVFTTTALSIIYWGIWEFPPLQFIVKHFNFIRLTSAVISGFSTIFLIYKYKNKLTVILPVMSALWFLFLTGYDEYYPFIAPVYLYALMMLFEYRKIDVGNTELLVAFFSVLPLIYIGFAPLAALALVYLILLNKEIVLKLVLIAASTFFIVLMLSWSSSIPSFFSQLYSDLSFGEKYNQILRYKGQFAGDTSIYFKSSYVFSAEHLKDLHYLLVYAGGVSGLLFLTLGVVILLVAVLKGQKAFVLPIQCKLLMLTILVFQQIYYFIYMVPKLGPTRDIDLYFTCHITVNFAAAFLLEHCLNRMSDIDRKYVWFILLSSALGYQAVTFYVLGVLGIPKI